MHPHARAPAMKRSAPSDSHGDDRGRQAPGRRRGDNLADPGVPRTTCVFKALCTESLTTVLLGSRAAIKEQIQQETGSKLVFSNKGDHFPRTELRVLGVFSEEARQILRALELILIRIIELGDEEKARPPPAGPEHLGKEPGEYVFRLCLCRQMAGLLIGSAGENVKRLRKDTGAKVFIDNDTVAGHRLVRVIGPAASIMSCLQQVHDIIQSDRETEEFQHEYSRVINFSAMDGDAGRREDGGRGGAGGGGGGREHDRDRRRDDGRGRDDGRARDDGRGRELERERERDHSRGGEHFGGSHSSGKPPRLDRAAGELLDMLAQDLSQFPPGTVEFHHCVSCAIPAAKVGALVGRSGEFVRRVEEQTRAKVDIAREGLGDERQMSCTGPLASIYNAHALMMQRLQEIENSERRPSDDRGAGDRKTPEELLANIAELQRQLDSVKGTYAPGQRRR